MTIDRFRETASVCPFEVIAPCLDGDHLTVSVEPPSGNHGLLDDRLEKILSATGRRGERGESMRIVRASHWR